MFAWSLSLPSPQGQEPLAFHSLWYSQHLMQCLDTGVLRNHNIRKRVKTQLKYYWGGYIQEIK